MYPKCHGEAARDSVESEGGHLALFEVQEINVPLWK